jgi:hypothetical protein
MHTKPNFKEMKKSNPLRNTFSYFAAKQYMGNILQPTALLLIFYWIIGYFAFRAGAYIHILLFMAAIAIIMRVMYGNRVIVE